MRAILGILLMGTLWAYDHTTLSQKLSDFKAVKQDTAIIYEEETDTLTPQALQKEISRCGIRFPEIVFRQAMLETGNLSCENCSLDRQNLFGFATDSGYLVFENWRQSVAYYYAWQKRKTFIPNDYYEFLRKYWGCENPEHYVAQLKRM